MIEPFVKLELFGSLYILRVLVELDYPRIFVCEDEVHSKFLFSECNTKENEDTWLVIRISTERYYQIISNQIHLREAYISSEEKKYYYVTYDYINNKEYIYENNGILNLEDLTKHDVYVGDHVNHESVHIAQIKEIARLTGQPTYDFVLYNNNPSVLDMVAESLSQLVSYLANIVKKLTNAKEPIRAMLSPNGSLIFRFSVKNPTFIDIAKTEEVFNKLTSIMSVKNPEELSSSINFSNQLFNEYGKVIELIQSTNSPLHILSVNPSTIQVQDKTISIQEIERTYTIIKDMFLTRDYDNHYNGTLYKIDKNSMKFGFMSIEDNIDYRGKIDDSLKDYTFTVPAIYSFDIKTHEVYDPNREDKKVNITHTLIGATLIE